MDKIEKIRQEIDERYQEYLAKMEGEHFTYYEGMADALDLFKQFVDTLAEEPNKSLEEAAHHIAIETLNDTKFMTTTMGYALGKLQDIFLAGAEWQYQKDRGEFARIKAKTWSEGFDDCKKQMLKDAKDGYVSAVIIHNDGDEEHYAVTYPNGERTHSLMDKVKIIIL